MNCDFKYCIYNRNFICTLKEIRINPSGVCAECNLIWIHDDFLDELKKNQLKDMNKEKN